MNVAELVALGQRAEAEAEAIQRHHERLERTPASVADVLLGRLSHGIDFARHDKLLTQLDAACKRHGDERVDGVSGVHTLRGIRDVFVGALALLEPYRKATP